MIPGMISACVRCSVIVRSLPVSACGMGRLALNGGLTGLPLKHGSTPSRSGSNGLDPLAAVARHAPAPPTPSTRTPAAPCLRSVRRVNAVMTARPPSARWRPRRRRPVVAEPHAGVHGRGRPTDHRHSLSSPFAPPNAYVEPTSKLNRLLLCRRGRVNGSETVRRSSDAPGSEVPIPGALLGHRPVLRTTLAGGDIHAGVGTSGGAGASQRPSEAARGGRRTARAGSGRGGCPASGKHAPRRPVRGTASCCHDPVELALRGVTLRAVALTRALRFALRLRRPWTTGRGRADRRHGLVPAPRRLAQPPVVVLALDLGVRE